MRSACLLVLVAFLALGGKANTLVQIRTPYTDLELELFDDDKPVTVRNFIRLIEAGAYQNSFFHRLQPGFVLQGGGFHLTGAGIGLVPHFGPITNEFPVGPRLSNTYGTVAMAKTTNSPNTATSQFFINLADNSANLDNQNGGFTVFGRVLRDGGLLPFLNTRAYGAGIVDLASLYSNTAYSVFSTLPVTYAGWRPPASNEFVYADITLLRVAVSNVGAGVSTIAWNSATGLTNLVEYTDGFSPPAWVSLAVTNGNGQRLSVTDTNAAAGRFYRVRVERP